MFHGSSGACVVPGLVDVKDTDLWQLLFCHLLFSYLWILSNVFFDLLDINPSRVQSSRKRYDASLKGLRFRGSISSQVKELTITDYLMHKARKGKARLLETNNRQSGSNLVV